MPQASHHHASNQDTPFRQPYHNPHTSMGASHWVRTAGILSPLLIGELVKDPDTRWRWIRIASVATAAISEIMWSHRISKERDQAREHALTCHSQG